MSYAHPGTQLLASATSTGPGSWFKLPRFDSASISFQGILSAISTCAAVIEVEVSNDGTNAIDTPLGTISLTIASSGVSSEGFGNLVQYGWARGNIRSITNSTNLTGVSLVIGA